jgi:hypothetical protein
LITINEFMDHSTPNSKINLEDYSILHHESMNIHRRLLALKSLPNEIISNKVDYMEEIRNSFKNPELIKLKALKVFDKINKNTINYKLYSEKMTLENHKKFNIPPVLLKKIDEKRFLIKKIMERKERKQNSCRKTKTLCIKTPRNVSQEDNAISQEINPTNKTIGSHRRIFSLNQINTELLPLKYAANKIKNNNGRMDFFN